MTSMGVIGCGGWGPNHIRNFSGLPGSKVIAAADLDAAALAHVSERFPGVQVEKDHRRLLGNPSISAVVIATPTATHFQMVKDSLLADKHVLCEKPLCQTSSEARELVDLARSRKRVLMVGHVFLFNAGILKIKELLDNGELGDLYYLSAVRTSLGPIRGDVNVAYDLAAHDIAIFNWLLGKEPESVSAAGAAFLQPGIEDLAFISLKYAGGVFANIHASWLNPKKVRQITLVGKKRMATWDDLELNTPVAIYDSEVNVSHRYGDYGEFLRISMWQGDVRLPKIQAEEPLRVQARSFLEAIQRGKPTRSDGTFGLGVVKTLEAVRQSLKLNGAEIRIGT